MQHKNAFTLWLLLAVACAAQAATSAAEKIGLYVPPAASAVRERVFAWVAARGDVDPQVQKELEAMWTLDGQPAPDALADLVIRSFCAADPETRSLVEACTLADGLLVPPDPKLQSADDANAFYRANVGTFYGQYLTRRRMYEEALGIFNQLNPVDMSDPAAYFFHKAVCEHRLLQHEQGLKTIETLLNKVVNVPARYSTVAGLMKYDLEAYREKSLDEISRLMSDVERRLDLGRAGQHVQKVEDDVISKLDELIKKAEEQSGSSSSSGSGQGRQNQSDNPANDSTIKGDTAPGEVDPKKLKNQGSWGALDPKQQAKAQNLINQNYPSSYRDAVEQYFKKLAGRPAPESRGGQK